MYIFFVGTFEGLAFWGNTKKLATLLGQTNGGGGGVSHPHTTLATALLMVASYL